jgi:hypothetical protein
MCRTSPEIPPCPPLIKGGWGGGFLARMGLIQNAAFDHVNLLWLFPIETMENWNNGMLEYWV